jgi:hypothetical protein
MTDFVGAVSAMCVQLVIETTSARLAIGQAQRGARNPRATIRKQA